MTDTIFALSTGALPAAIAVVRVSGPNAFKAVEALAGSLPEPRRASLRALRSPDTAALLDRALVLVFPALQSVTGEDLAEFHLHGGRAVVRAVEATLAALPRTRAAQAGEFTRRALESGRIDLTEAEGLADLLSAETEAQRRAAMRSAEGGIRRKIEEWTTATVAIAALIESAIDHEDEDDVGEAAPLLREAHERAAALVDEIAIVLAQPPVERLRDGIRVVLAGPPNSGKSTLINALAERDVAIVSPIAGTTRDRIEAPVVRGGHSWIFTDTAGLTDTTDPIEAIGVDRARESMATADIVLWLGDDLPPSEAFIPLHARADEPGREQLGKGRVSASGVTADGTAALWKRLTSAALTLVPAADVLALNNRQRHHCRSAAEALRYLAEEADPLFAAEHARLATRAFDEVTGRAGTEQVLDALFSRFCIGK
jgi:tRNA modification GTPase